MNIEIKNKRSLNAKHFDIPKGSEVKITTDKKDKNGNTIILKKIVEFDGQYKKAIASSTNIHYFDKLDSKRFREIDQTLHFDNNRKGWFFNYHYYRPFLPEYANDWFSYRDLFDEKDQTISMRAVCNKVKGKLVIPNKEDKIGNGMNYIIYENAFGEGIDLIFYLGVDSLFKVVRIKDKNKEIKDYVFDFEIELPKDKDTKELPIKRALDKFSKDYYILDINRSKKFNSNKETLIGKDKEDGKEWFTYLEDFKVWDSKSKKNIEVDFVVEKNGKRILRKSIPKSFVKESVGDIFTDTIFNCDKNQTGQLLSGAGTWSSAHSGSGIDKSTNSGTSGAGVEYSNFSHFYYIERSFVTVDTSSIPSDAEISAVELIANRQDGYFSGSGGNYFVTVVEFSPTSPTSISTSDWSNFSTTELIDSGERITSGGSGVSFDFNSTGIGEIAKGGTTNIGLRNGFDKNNSSILTTEAIIYSWFVNYSGHTDPRLDITYSVPSTSNFFQLF